MKINRRGFLGALATFVAAPFIPIPKAAEGEPLAASPLPVVVNPWLPPGYAYLSNPIADIEAAMEKIRAGAKPGPEVLYVSEDVYQQLKGKELRFEPKQFVEITIENPHAEMLSWADRQIEKACEDLAISAKWPPRSYVSTRHPGIFWGGVA